MAFRIYCTVSCIDPRTIPLSNPPTPWHPHFVSAMSLVVSPNSLSAFCDVQALAEHFSTPLHFASTHFNLTATLTPFPSGTGHMVSSLRANEIDVGIGLTEGWVAGLADGQGGYSIVGTYVETPLCWAISTGKGREDLTVERLKGRKCGVSRVGRQVPRNVRIANIGRP
jgi:hypothetical protein